VSFFYLLNNDGRSLFHQLFRKLVSKDDVFDGFGVHNGVDDELDDCGGVVSLTKESISSAVLEPPEVLGPPLPTLVLFFNNSTN
jgi:hypothetical protein